MSTSASASNAALEPSGAARLLEAAAAHNFGLAVFIRVTLLSGARRGELLDLRWPDIRKPDTSGECGFLDITCLDGGKTTYARRRIAIDPGTMALLGKWQSEHAGPDSRGPVFATEPSGDRGWNPVWVSRQVRRLAVETRGPGDDARPAPLLHDSDGRARRYARRSGHCRRPRSDPAARTGA